MDVIEQFKKHARSASYHFADDTTDEWHLGNKEQSIALQIFDDNPELQSEMREAAKGELWSLSRERPVSG